MMWAIICIDLHRFKSSIMHIVDNDQSLDEKVEALHYASGKVMTVDTKEEADLMCDMLATRYKYPDDNESRYIFMPVPQCGSS